MFPLFFFVIRVTVFNPSPFYPLILTFVFIYFILPTRYSVLLSLYCCPLAILFSLLFLLPSGGILKGNECSLSDYRG